MTSTKSKPAAVPPPPPVTGRHRSKTSNVETLPGAPALKDPKQHKTVDATAAAKKLMAECGAMRIRWTWMRTNAKVDAASKETMAHAAGSTAKGISASKKMMDSKHPTVKEANELRGRISSYIRGISLPVVKLGEAGSKQKEGGVYLIRKTDTAAFDERMVAFQSELKTMEAKVNADMPSIKAADKEQLGDLYDDKDYSEFTPLRLNYLPVNLDPPAYLEEFAPEMFERERQRAEEGWQDIYDNAASEFMTEFQAVINSWVGALGPVVFIYPDEKHELARLNGAEVRKRITHDWDATIPEGQFNLVVRYRPPGTKGKSVEETIGPMSESEYADLLPNEKVDKCRTFQSSTVENLLAMVSKFRMLGQTISASTGFNDVVTKIEQQLKNAGTKPGEVGDELRKSKTFRSQTHGLMRQLSDNLTAEIETFTRKRRRVISGVATPGGE